MSFIPRSRKFKDVIAQAAKNNFAVPHIGIVVSDNDPISSGRFLTQIPALGWNTDDKAVWCYLTDKKSYVAPKINDYVIVQFVDGKIDFPIITGCANKMKDMITKLYNQNKDVLYENPDKTHITYDGQSNILEIGNKDFNFSARLNDQIKSTSSEDAAFWAWLSGFVSVFSTWVPVPGDGGAALKAALLLWLVGNPVPSTLTGKITSASDQVKVGKK